MAGIDNDLTLFGTLVSTEAFGGLVTAINNQLEANRPGEIAPMIIAPGYDLYIDPTIWQLCDGSQITEPLSPLRGSFTPDLRDTYLKGASNLATCGNFGGSNTRDFSHAHGGQTSEDPGGNIIVDRVQIGDRYYEGGVHTHSIPNGLGVYDMQPLRYHVKFYLKIR